MGKLYSSPSKLETYALCRRKWYLIYVKKLGVPRGRQFMFGSVLHAAAERYLLKQELWPEGWDLDPDTKERVTPAEGALIQVLVQAGIDAGIIERRPGGEVEQWIKLEHGEDVVVRGLVDYGTDDRVEDHKTSKSERYMKSPEGLRKSIQMMVYGKERVARFRRRGQLPPAVITLVHNQFKKDFDDPMVRRREVEVSPAEIDQFWEDVVVPLLDGMVEDQHAKNPFDLPDPPAKSCRAFGGCDFISICSGGESLLSFEKRMTKLSAANKEPKTITMTSPNDFLNRRGGKASPAAAPTVNPPAPPEVKEEQPKPITPAADSTFSAPPWFSEKCPLCAKAEYKGFNMKTGKPCRICPTKSKVGVEDYVWSIEGGAPMWHKEGEQPVKGPAPAEVEDKGTKTVFTAADLFTQMRKAPTIAECDQILVRAEELELSDTDASLMSTLYGERCAVLEIQEKHNQPEPKTVEAKVEMKPTPPADTVPVDDEGEPVMPEETPEETPAPEESPLQVEEPGAGGLTLLIGCSPLKGLDVVFAEDVLSKLEGYWSNTNAFDRRESLRRAIEEQGDLLSSLEGMTIVQSGRDPDIDNLMSSLIPHATVVIRGTIQ